MQGQDITEAAEPPAEPARIIDLMAALKASLGKGKGAGAGARARAPPPAESDEPAASRRSARNPRPPAPSQSAPASASSPRVAQDGCLNPRNRAVARSG